MTNAASTGLTAPPENLRVVSMQSGIIRAEDGRSEAFAIDGTGAVENFRSGEDVILLPAGTDLSKVTVAAGWQDDAWGLLINTGAAGGEGVFLRWSWQFDPARDLAVAAAAPAEPAVPAEPAEPGTGGGQVVEGAVIGTGPDTLVLSMSSESYAGDAQFLVHVDGRQVGGVFTATAEHGAATQAFTLRGDWGGSAEVGVTFVNDLWGGTAETDRNLHIDGATFNGEAVAGAAQTVWGDYRVDFTAGQAPGAGPEAPPTDAPPETPPVETPPGAGGGNAGGGTPPAGGGSPEGYSLVLSDDFSDGYLYENWGWPFGGGVYWNGGFSWNSDDVAVRDGEMQVSMTRQADGWWTAGGFNSFKAGNTITYGKIEFDAKVPNYQGTMTAILTWPASDQWPVDGEIDILETPHNENMFSTHYAGPNGEHYYDSIRSSTFDAAQWNHYELTWLPDRMTIEVNGQLVAEWTDPAQIPDTPHGFGAMGFVGTAVDQWMGGAPDSSTPDRVTVSLDNVVMYQADGIF